MGHRRNNSLRQAGPCFAQPPHRPAPVPSTADLLLQKAVAHHQAGELPLAEALYRRVLQLSPDHPGALFLLGTMAYATGNYALSLELIDKVLQINPRHAEAYSYRGNALYGLQQYQAAVESYDKAIRLKPDSAEAYINRGSALHELEQYQAAVECYDKAIRLKPDSAEAYNNRGNALHALQRYQESLESCDKAIRLKPDYAEAYGNRGNALQGLQLYEAALESYDKAVTLKPDFAEAYRNRGNVFYALQQYEAALESYDKAIACKPDSEYSHACRGNALLGLHRYSSALESYNAAMYLDSESAYLPEMPIFVKQFLCDWEDLEAQRQRLKARLVETKRAVMPFAFLSISDCPALQKKAAELYVLDKFPRRSDAAAIPLRPRHDRIRIGYFSGNFYSHPICYLMAELFERHDRSKFEVVGFSFGPPVQDAMRERVTAAMDRFVDVRSMPDRAAAKLCRELEIDIAVDLMGHTEGGRTGIFAERAAPVQVNYLGYPGTMGASYIDYIFADKILIPEMSRPHYSEKVIYLPDCFQANQTSLPVADASKSRAAEGLPEDSFVFCCFNNNYKISPSVFDIWMRILSRVEGSVLWLFVENSLVRDNLRKEAERRGVPPERLIFARSLPLAEHMARQRLADLFLDTLPFNAGATASPALWAGLPILTRTGESFSGRMATSLLHAVGMPELITATEEEYEDTAVAIATTPGRAQALKEKLLHNRQTTPLFDLPTFTAHIEAAYTAMYERSLAGLAPEHLSVERKTRTSY